MKKHTHTHANRRWLVPRGLCGDMYNGSPMAAGLSPIDETPGRDGEAKRLEHVLVNLLAERDRLACRCAEGEEALRAAEEKLKEGEARNAALVRQLHAVLPEIEVRMRGEGRGQSFELG